MKSSDSKILINLIVLFFFGELRSMIPPSFTKTMEVGTGQGNLHGGKVAADPVAHVYLLFKMV